MTKKQCEQPQPVPELKDPCLSKQLLPFFHPLWRLKEQRPLGLGGARGGEMLQANRGAGPDAAQTSLWHYVFNSSPQVPPWVSLLWGSLFFFFPLRNYASILNTDGTAAFENVTFGDLLWSFIKFMSLQQRLSVDFEITLRKILGPVAQQKQLTRSK